MLRSCLQSIEVQLLDCRGRGLPIGPLNAGSNGRSGFNQHTGEAEIGGVKISERVPHTERCDHRAHNRDRNLAHHPDRCARKTVDRRDQNATATDSGWTRSVVSHDLGAYSRVLSKNRGHRPRLQQTRASRDFADEHFAR